MTDKEVMQQALEALERADKDDFWREQRDAITALRTALEQGPWEPSDTAHRPGGLPQDFTKHPPAAQPEQWDKPSASFNEWWDSDSESKVNSTNPFRNGSAAYWAWAGWQAAQRPWQGLTDEAIWEIHDRCIPPTEGYVSPVDFARAIEAKLKERNNA